MGFFFLLRKHILFENMVKKKFWKKNVNNSQIISKEFVIFFAPKLFKYIHL